MTIAPQRPTAPRAAPTVDDVVLDLLLPQRCVVCALPGAQVCAACLARFPRLVPPRCARCGAPTAWPVDRCVECSGRRLAFARASAAVVYDDAVRAFVAAWKERGLRRLAAIAADLVVETLDRPARPLTFVATDPARGLSRGYRPAETLARELAARWDVQLLPLLERAPRPRQRRLTLAERRANVRGAFSARSSPREVVLIDDVYTSGATANAAASALRAAGARRVEVVTLARAVRGYTVRPKVIPAR